MFRISLSALLLGAALAATSVAIADEASTGRTEATIRPSTASTGGTETRLVPAAPRAPIRLELGAGEAGRQIEGRTSAADAATVLWSAPVGPMITARLSSPGNQARLSVYQPGSDAAEPGTRAEQGAIAWIGAMAREGELRLEVHTKSTEEIPFRISFETTASISLGD